MRVTRVARGITSTAIVGIGEVICFPCGIDILIKDIRHQYVPAQSKVAPNTTLMGVVETGSVDDYQIGLMLRDGFEDM